MILGMDQDTFVLESGNLTLRNKDITNVKAVTRAGAKLMESKSVFINDISDHFQ
jgi:hypothetical protein